MQKNNLEIELVIELASILQVNAQNDERDST